MQTKDIYFQGRVYQNVTIPMPTTMHLVGQGSGYNNDAEAWIQHLSTLANLPVICNHPFPFIDGSEVILGKDYEVKKNCPDLKCTDKERNDIYSTCCEAIALPLPSADQHLQSDPLNHPTPLEESKEAIEAVRFAEWISWRKSSLFKSRTIRFPVPHSTIK